MRLLDALDEGEILVLVSMVRAFETAWAAEVEPGPEEREQVASLGNDLSAHYALMRSGATDLVFRAVDEDGTIIHRYPDDSESIPFYPAEYWLLRDLRETHPGVRAVRSSVDEWKRDYLSPMSADGLFVELLPQPSNHALLADPLIALQLVGSIRGEFE